jgi:2-amino-4-hydroxy-6-hydroxymethyldihydropteridine diphosphokinase
MILIGLGSNISSPWGTPRDTVLRALRELDNGRTQLLVASRVVESAPFGRMNQPNFVNAVARIATALPPEALMLHLHALERRAGRQRPLRWGPRTLDLDLLDYHGLVRHGQLILPHPGIADRDFVLTPLMEIAPGWRHPVTRLSARAMHRRLSGIVHGGTVLKDTSARG